MAVSVAVVGAGVCGFSTALCIKNKNPNIGVTVIADVFSPNTCSDGAAGIMLPYLMGDTPEHLQRYRSYEKFKKIIYWKIF